MLKCPEFNDGHFGELELRNNPEIRGVQHVARDVFELDTSAVNYV